MSEQVYALIAMLLLALFKTYPETRIVRKILKNTDFSNQKNVVVTFITVLVFEAIWMFGLYDIKITLQSLTFDILCLLLWSYRDLKQKNYHSKWYKFSRNYYIKAIFGIVLWFFLTVFIKQLLPIFGVDDVYYLVSMIISIIYVVLALSRSKEEKELIKSMNDQIRNNDNQIFTNQ